MSADIGSRSNVKKYSLMITVIVCTLLVVGRLAMLQYGNHEIFSNENASDQIAFDDKILDICDGHFFIETVEGSLERNSADLIEVPI